MNHEAAKRLLEVCKTLRTKPVPISDFIPVLQGAADHIDDLAAQLELFHKVIAWANNSLYGSHGFFLSDHGGPPDEHHLDRQIEVIKKQTRDQFVELEAAFALLALNGIPRERAKTVANGIDVLITRMQKECDALNAELEAAKKDAERRAIPPEESCSGDASEYRHGFVDGWNGCRVRIALDAAMKKEDA